MDLLTTICNLSLHLPSLEDWKVANITPIFKKDSWGEPGKLYTCQLNICSEEDCGNCYRFKDKIINHLKIQALLKGNQNGFPMSTKLLKFFC